MTTPDTDTDTAPGPAPTSAERRLVELTDVLERITDAFFALDDAWRFTFVNRQAGRLLFRDPADLLGRCIWEEFPDVVDSTFGREYQRARREGTAVTFTDYYPPLDGWLEVNAYPGANGLSVYFRDVSVARRAQQELALSQVHLGLALEAGSMGTWEWDIAESRMTWSPQEERLYGLAPGAFDGSVESYRARIHPDDVERSWRLLEQALARRAEHHHVVHRIVRPDGAVRWLDSYGRFIYADDGRPLRLVGLSTDVTERREMEEALRYRSYIQDTITNNATAALFMMDADGHPTFMNPAATAMTGFTLEEIRDFPLHYAIHHRHPDGSPYPMAECPVDRALPENFDVRAHEDVFIRKDGTYFPVLCAASPIFEDGRPVGTVVEVRDVTEERRREGALRESEERFRLLTQAIPVQVWTAGSDGRLDFVSDRAAEFFGRPTADLVGDGWTRFVHPEDLPAAAERWAAALASGEPYEAELRLRRRDGEWRWHLARAVARRDADGRPRLWFGSNTDVSDMRAAEEALREREREFRTLADVIPQFVWTATADGEHVYFNQRFYDYTGASPDDVRGLAWARLIHPDDAAESTRRWRAALAAGAAYEAEYRVRRAADGAWRWFIGRAVPLRDAEGRVVKWFGTSTDIEDQKAAERARDEALAAAERERGRLFEVLQQAPAAVAITRGPEHVFVMQNALSRQIAGRDVVGRAVRQAFPELDSQGIIELFDTVYRTGEPLVANELYVRLDRDGDGVAETDGYFNVVYQPVREFDGTISGVLAHAVEVTEQVRARQEVEANAEELARVAHALEQSNRELDQFAYVTSHDLKAPLRGIANLTQWIEEDLGERVSGESAEHMRLLKGRVHRMEALIDGILTYSRAARARSQPEPVDTGLLAAEVVDLLAPEPGVVAVAPGMPTVVTERVPLQQVFMNLVGNALKHGRAETPRVAVGWRDADGGYEFSVADNGPGIAPEYHDRIWGIFQTLDARDKVEGTGIGLAVVKKIVESRGGRVWVESARGAGATFRFTWPRGA